MLIPDIDNTPYSFPNKILPLIPNWTNKDSITMTITITTITVNPKPFHPEQHSDEVFMGNSPFDLSVNYDEPLESIWTSLRYGKVALDNKGQWIPKMHPMFVLRSEVEAKLKRINDESYSVQTLEDLLRYGHCFVNDSFCRPTLSYKQILINTAYALLGLFAMIMFALAVVVSYYHPDYAFSICGLWIGGFIFWSFFYDRFFKSKSKN